MQLQMAVLVLTAHVEVVAGEAARSKQMGQTQIHPLMQLKVPVPILKQTMMMDVEIAAVAAAFAVPVRLQHRS